MERCTTCLVIVTQKQCNARTTLEVITSRLINLSVSRKSYSHNNNTSMGLESLNGIPYHVKLVCFPERMIDNRSDRVVVVTCSTAVWRGIKMSEITKVFTWWMC